MQRQIEGLVAVADMVLTALKPKVMGSHRNTVTRENHDRVALVAPTVRASPRHRTVAGATDGRNITSPAAGRSCGSEVLLLALCPKTSLPRIKNGN